MTKGIYAGELRCPLCQSTMLSATYMPSNRRVYVFEGEEYTDFYGETCDLDCDDCSFSFSYPTEQEL